MTLHLHGRDARRAAKDVRVLVAPSQPRSGSGRGRVAPARQSVSASERIRSWGLRWPALRSN